MAKSNSGQATLRRFSVIVLKNGVLREWLTRWVRPGVEEMGPPIKRLVVRIGGEVRRPVGWRRFVPLDALAGVPERLYRAKGEFSIRDSSRSSDEEFGAVMIRRGRSRGRDSRGESSR